MKSKEIQYEPDQSSVIECKACGDVIASASSEGLLPKWATCHACKKTTRRPSYKYNNHNV